MARNMSFAMTTPQFIDRSKTVTRRWGWKFLAEKYQREGFCHQTDRDIIQGVEKAMGLQRGEKMKRLGLIEVVSATFEPLDRMITDRDYGLEELCLEGYPFGMTDPAEFVERLAREGKKQPHDLITRIEFKHIEGDLL